MKQILTSFLILATSLVAQARLIRNWSDQELFDQSDLVVIAKCRDHEGSQLVFSREQAKTK